MGGGVIRRTIFVIFTIVLLLIMSETELGNHNFIPSDSTPILVAHRAGSTFAPENTISALENAIDNGADQAEIDVQQLRDGTLIVMHDTNFKRTTGVDLNVWDADYSEIQTLNAGAYFSYIYKNEAIPTLEQMLQTAKGRINLMIKLKINGHEENLEQAILALIKEHNMEQQCSIASMDLEILKRVKVQMPQMETVYITALLLSNSYDLYR